MPLKCRRIGPGMDLPDELLSKLHGKYFAKSEDPSSEIVLSKSDLEYLQGLHDAGTAGAAILMGVIQTDGKVAIWVGE